MKRKKRITEISDEYFFNPIDSFTNRSPSYCENLNSKQLWKTMLCMYFNFYTISAAVHPFRVIRVNYNLLFNGREETRYAKIPDRITKLTTALALAGAAIGSPVIIAQCSLNNQTLLYQRQGRDEEPAASMTDHAASRSMPRQFINII